MSANGWPRSYWGNGGCVMKKAYNESGIQLRKYETAANGCG